MNEWINERMHEWMNEWKGNITFGTNPSHLIISCTPDISSIDTKWLIPKQLIVKIILMWSPHILQKQSLINNQSIFKLY